MSQARDLIRQGAAERERGGDLAAARLLLERAVELSGSASDLGELADALRGYGRLERDLGNLDSSLLAYEEAASVARSAELALPLAHALRHIGAIRRDMGRLADAEHALAAALALYRDQSPEPSSPTV